MRDSSITFWILALFFTFIAFTIDGLTGVIAFGFFFLVWLLMLAVIKLLRE